MSAETKKIYKTIAPFILASGSPRRKDLLCSVGLDFEVIPSQADEPAPEANEKPDDYAVRMARLKTEDVAHKHQAKVTVGADTIVVFGDEVMGKPASEEDALRMLAALSGQTHRVITGVCIMFPNGGKTHSFSVSTDVFMRECSVQELNNYIATGEPADKAGAYAIQGIGSFMVRGISGSYTNVVGLPLSRVLDVLLERSIIASQSADSRPTISSYKTDNA